MLISIILPVHNQADHIREIVQGYIDVMPGLIDNYEFILVPNACTDDSAACLPGLATANPSIKVVSTAKGGWGNAVKLGLASS